ncbi:MAG: agmatinase [Magnetococcales bacterium]|nr:agmatinase [Magnetococcales bacterium]
MQFLDVKAAPLASARVVILPVCYGGTLSYGVGAHRGPEALLHASGYLELFDETLQSEPYAVGIHTLPFLEPDQSGPEATLAKIRQSVRPHLASGAFVATIGGEHSVSWAPVVELADLHGPESFSILHLDAHTDARDTFQGTRWSHACVMRRISELGVPIVSVGVRSFCREEWNHLKGAGESWSIFPAEEIIRAVRRGDDHWIDPVISRLRGTVYITLDLDVLDPSIMPATGTPEPGGLDYLMVLDLIRRVAAERRIIACDVMELAPIPGQAASDVLAAKLLYKLIAHAES